MPKKYSYNGTSFSYDQLLEKYGTDDNVQKAITQFGFKETEDAGEILPGKRKTVAKKDAGATVKSTVSKPVKSSSASQSNPFGEDRSQPEFLTNLQKQAKTLVPKTKDVFNPKKFAKEVTSSDTDGFYTKGEKNIQKSGIKENKLEADIVDNVFNNFETLNYAKLTPEQKLNIDNQAVQILQTKQPAGASYNIQPADIELKAQEILTKASDKKNKIIGESYINRLLDGVAKGADYVGEAFASIPETVYRVFAAPQNIYATISGDKDAEVTPEKFKKSMGVTNPMMDYFIDEQKRIGKKNNIYDNANYDSQSITKNISNGNYSDAFRLLGSGLAESAPVSIGFMAGGANMGIAKLAAASTAAMAGPEIRIQAEENPGQSEIENVINGFGMAGAETVFSAIGEGSIGKVYKDIILKEGLETGSKIFKDGLITTYQTALKKYGVPVSMLGEGLEEVATTVTQNLISKKPAFEGTMDSFVAGVGGGTVYGAPITLQKSIQDFKSGVTTYKVNTQLKDSGIANIKEVFNPATPVNDTQINIALIPNSYKILSNQVDTDIADDKMTAEEGANIKKEFANTYHAAIQLKPLELPTNVNTEVANLLKDRDQLNVVIKNVNDPTLTTFQSDKVKEINGRISELTSNVAKEKIQKSVEQDIARTKTFLSKFGFENTILESFDDDTELKKYLTENTKYTEKEIDFKIKNTYGLFVPLANGKEVFIINKNLATKDFIVTTGQHEFLHKLIYAAVKDNPALQIKVGGSLYEYLEKNIGSENLQNTKFAKRFEEYAKDFDSEQFDISETQKKAKEWLARGVITKEQYATFEEDAIFAETKFYGKFLEEVLPLLSESISSKDIVYNETFFTKIGDILRKVFQQVGLSKVNFETGEDVFNFIRDYNKSFEKGKFTKAFELLAKEGKYKGAVQKSVESKDNNIIVKESKAGTKLQSELIKEKIAGVKENIVDYDPYEYDQEIARLNGELKRAITKEAIGTPNVTNKESVKKETAEKEPRSKGNLQNLLDVKYEGNQKRLASEGLRKTPSGGVTNDFSKSIIGKELGGTVETITRRLYDPIAPDAKRNVTRDEYKDALIQSAALLINNEFDPSKQTLDKFISSRLNLRANALAYELGIEGATKGGIKKDASEEKSLMATETADQGFAEAVKEKSKYKNALEAKVFPAEVLESSIKKIITILRTVKSRIDAPVSLNKTVTPLIAEIRDEVGKQLDIDVKTMLGGKKDGVLKKELLRTKRYVLENMTTTWLMGKDGQGGIPMAIQKQIDGKWVNFPEWVGKKIDREKTTTDQAGRTSGAELVRRLPNVANNISDEVYLAQIIGPDGNPIRGRKESLSKAMSEEGAFDIINADLEEQGPIYDALKTNQTRLGVEALETLSVEISRQIERGNVKEAKSIIKGVDISFEKLGKDISNAKTIVEEAKVISNWIASDGRSLRTIAAMIGSKLKKFTTNKSLFDNVLLPIIKVNSKFEGLVGENSYRLGNVRKGVSIFFGEDKVPLWKDIDEIKANFEKSAPEMEKQSIEAIAQLFDIINYFKENDYSKDDFEAYIQFLRKDQRGLIRKLSKPGIAIVGMSKKQQPHLEHNMPVQNIVEKILDFYDDKITEDELREFVGNGRVNLVPDNFNSILPNYKEGKNRMEDPAVLLEIQDLLDKGYTVYNIKGEYGSKANFDALVKLAQSKVNSKESIQNIYNTIAINKSLDIKESKAAKGISVFDFDDTSAFTSGSVLYTMPDGSKGKLNAEEFAKEGNNILDNGGVFDFSEFSKVVNGKPGPMVEKMKKMIAKFGNENFFILTARPANAAVPIKEFLDSIGIDIPLENITGLGNSTAQAKADWITAKAAEGYNDFYFADDAIQNVEAVKNALDVLDVKSKIQQAKIKFSKTIGPEFNRIISKNTGIGPAIEYSDIVAKRKGAGKNLFDLYVPASAADFELLLYNFIGKGREGEAQKEFFADALLKPYANGNDLMDAARQSIKNNYKQLIKAFPGIAKKLEKLTPDGNFTYDQALRVAMWNGSGVEIPGLSKRDVKELTSLVNNDTELYDFMSGLIVLGRQGNGWVNPDEYWDAGTIISDLHNLTEGEGRKQFLSEFVDNAEQMFGKFENGKLVGPNMNKIQAIYGTDVRESIEDVLYRMINGKNRSQGKDKITNAWFDWVSGSTGTIMFLNTRSAALQLIGAVNFLNLRDNNPIAAAKAFANQKQYWEDFGRIWNSDKMKERRGGLKEDVAAAEIANAAATSKNKPKAVVAYLLKIGYTPTQIADSFAIASGGAPFYRNRIKTYLKEGQTEVEAEKNAWNDFTKVSDETQQSGDPRDISKQQASGAGRLLLTFQNTAMQQSRIVKKSFLDLKNGRGDAKTHITKIAYYIAIQNLMFATLQQGLFAVLPGLGDDEEKEEDKKKRLKEKDKKLVEIASGVVDTVVRGTGLLGGVMVTLKNVIKKYMEERPKEYKADYTKVLLETTNISPPIGSKLRKIYTGLQQTKFDKDLIKERGWGVMQDGRVHLGPLYSVAGKGVEATTNLPMDRLVTKVENISQALNSQNTATQRTMIALGWTPRSVGVGSTAGDTAIEAAGKATREEEGLIKAEETRENTKDSISQLPASERMRLKIEGKLKRRENEIKRRERKANRKMG